MRIFFLAATLFIWVNLNATVSHGQVRINLNLNKQPEWGPAGYERVDYYYLPDIDVYYSVNTREFIYQDNHRWIHRTELPRRYKNYDLYNNYKVIVNESQPWSHNDEYHRRYAGYRGRHDQVLLRDRRDPHYKRNDRSNRNHSREDLYRRRRAQQSREEQQREASIERRSDDQDRRGERH